MVIRYKLMTDFKGTTFKRVLFTLIMFFGLSSMVQAGDQVVIGISPSLTATLSIIAKQLGFFSQQGIDADIRVIESGSKAVALMLNDEIDISESTIFALVSNSFNRRDFKIYTQVSISGNDNMIVARKNKGIRKIMDLKGKKIGVLKGGYPQYVLDLMLLNAGINPKEVKLFHEEADRLYQMLSSGELDAACLYGFWIDKAARVLKENAVLFHDEKLIRVTVVHTGKSKTFDRKPELFKQILKAYIKAEKYVKRNPDAVLKIVVDYLKLDIDNARKVWKPNLAHVALEQSLVKDMENMAQWQINLGIQKNIKIPNYLDFIHYRSLMEVDPMRVTIAH
jgi:ABC-type nitrate/sulfonate/bicarbonate transport system substrate-binding protein